MVDAGDIVLVPVATHNGLNGTYRNMLGLVLKVVESDQKPPRLWVAKGSIHRVSASGSVPGEVVLTERPELKAAGLFHPTRFDLTDNVWVSASGCKHIGKFPLHAKSHVRALMGAMRDARLQWSSLR